jgi:8-oxo-dGTP diphosphatase
VGRDCTIKLSITILITTNDIGLDNVHCRGDCMFIVNVEGAIYKDEKWLIIRRSEKEEHAGGAMSLVGGKVELEGTSTDILESTLKREISEEVGIEVMNLRYVNSSSFVTDSGLNVVDIVFLCDHQSGEAFARSSDEVESIVWMTTQQIITNSDLPIYLKESIKIADKMVKAL